MIFVVPYLGTAPFTAYKDLLEMVKEYHEAENPNKLKGIEKELANITKLGGDEPDETGVTDANDDDKEEAK